MKRFTPRELEVIDLLILGLSNREIAEKLFISHHTAKAHIASIYKKMNVVNRVQAALMYSKLVSAQKMEDKTLNIHK